MPDLPIAKPVCEAQARCGSSSAYTNRPLRTYEGRTREINHALMVIAQLQGSLDMERGGEVARNLAKFYALLRAGLTEAQVKQSARILEQQISQLVEVHEAWLEVERATAKTNPPSHEPASNAPTPPPSETAITDWNA